MKIVNVGVEQVVVICVDGILSMLVMFDYDEKLIGDVILWMDNWVLVQVCKIEVSGYQVLRCSCVGVSVEMVILKIFWLKEMVLEVFVVMCWFVELVDFIVLKLFGMFILGFNQIINCWFYDF